MSTALACQLADATSSGRALASRGSEKARAAAIEDRSPPVTSRIIETR